MNKAFLLLPFLLLNCNWSFSQTYKPFNPLQIPSVSKPTDVNQSKANDSQEFDLVWFAPNKTLGSVPRFEKLELGVQFSYTINKAIENYLIDGGTDAGLNPFNPEDIEIKAEFERMTISASDKKTLTKAVNYAKVYGFYYKEFERDIKNRNPERWGWNEVEMMDNVNSKYNFRIRFAPPELGTWKCKVTAKVKGFPIITSNEFAFTCTESDNHGYMKIGGNKKYFTIDNKTYVPAGKNFPSPEQTYHYDSSWKNYEGPAALKRNTHRFTPANFLSHLKSLEQYHETGGQFFRMMLFGSAFEIEHEHLNNYFDRMNSSWELDRFVEGLKTNDLLMQLNLQYTSSFQELDGYDVIYNWTSNHDHPVDASNPRDNWGGACKHCYVCQKKNDVGYCYHTDLGLKEPYEFFVNKEAKKYYKRRLRYLVSRWGYSTNITIFEMINEISGINGKGYYKFNADSRKCEEVRTDDGKSVYYTSKIDGKPLRDVPSVPVAISDWHHEMGGFLKNDQHFSQLTAVSYLVDGPAVSEGDSSYYSENIDIRTFNTYYGSFSGWRSEAQHMIIDNVKYSKNDTEQTRKPMYYSETGDGEHKKCDNGLGFIENLWKPFFTGAAGAGNTWYFRYELDKNQQIKMFQDFVSGIHFASKNVNWISQTDNWSANEVEMFALVSNEENIRAIGVVDNKTVNFHSIGLPNSPCTKEGSANNLDDNLKVALALENDNSLFAGNKIKLEKMGFKKKYIIDWYSIPSGVYHSSVTKRSTAGSKLKLEFPELGKTVTTSLYAFKVRRVDEPRFITTKDSSGLE